MIDFNGIRERARAAGREARAKAEEGVKPEAGHVYTVSPSFDCGDRSWIDCFWEIVAETGPHVLVKIHSPYHTQSDPLVRLFLKDDRAWYLADEVFRLSRGEIQ